MFDKILRFLATADLIGAAKAATARGQVVLVHRGCGASDRSIKRLLKQNRVEVKDVFVLTRPNLLHIVVDDYDKAIRILNKAGIRGTMT